MPRNWPTEDAVNARIRLSAQVNGKDYGDLTGMAPFIMQMGRRYGINPGVVVAIMQRESQLGMDGSMLPTRHNYAGITAKPDRGDCEPFFHNDRYWACCTTTKCGIEMLFKVLAEPRYWGKNLGGVVETFAPSYENDHAEIWRIYGAVAQQLGITLNKKTRVSAWWWRNRPRYPRPGSSST